MNNYNRLSEIRTTSTFESYEPFSDSQRQAIEFFQALAGELIANSLEIGAHANPFPSGKLMIFSGPPGVGKTHLTEALINQIKTEAPDVYEKMFLLRATPLGYVTGYNPSGYKSRSFHDKPIIIIDDLFSDKASVKDICSATEIKSLMALVSGAYEKRHIIITTCNFPFLTELLPLIEGNDPTGRVVSRCHEMVCTQSGEMTIEGPDYRKEMTQRRLEAGGGSSILGLDELC